MKIIKDYPPNIKRIKEVFNLDGYSPIFAYGDVIYSPKSTQLREDLIVHESVHQRQQGNDVEGWWNKYLIDASFRLSQEIEAYSTQYKFYCKLHKDRNTQNRFLVQIAMDLSSAMYGNIITVEDAYRQIKNF